MDSIKSRNKNMIEMTENIVSNLCNEENVIEAINKIKTGKYK